MARGIPDSVARREKVLAEVRRILIDNVHLDIPADTIDPDVPLFGTGLGLDSVDAIELVVSAEHTFAISIPQKRVKQSLRTVNTFVDLVLDEQRLQGKG